MEIATLENFATSEDTALERLTYSRIDIVLLDAALPGTDTIGLIKKIRKNFPQTEIIMLSEHRSDSASITFEALSEGAIDFIIKPAGIDAERIQEIMKNRLCDLFTQITVKRYSTQTLNMTNQIRQEEHVTGDVLNSPGLCKSPVYRPNFTEPDIIVMAASTGGPSAIEAVCSTIPESFKKPILIVQHLPAEFTRVLSESLDGKCPLKVVEGREGLAVKPGHIIIAPGGMHMEVVPDSGCGRVLSLKSSPHVNGVRPSADVLFSSVAKAYEGRGIVAVVLTGMGCDGLKGVMEMKKKCRCYCITQTEQSCVVYGMPRSVHEAGLSDECLDLGEISCKLQQLAVGRSC